MLHGATLVFVTPGYEGKRFIYERAQALGVRSVIFDEPGSWAERLVEEKVIAKFVPVQLNQDSDEVFADALAAMRALEVSDRETTGAKPKHDGATDPEPHKIHDGDGEGAAVSSARRGRAPSRPNGNNAPPLAPNDSCVVSLSLFSPLVSSLRKDDPLVGAPAGCCTFCELSVPLVARLCEALGLPGPSAAAIDTARDKHRTRAAMAAAGLPSPANAKIEDAAALARAAATVGFPAVLKPLSGAASLGVKKVESEGELVGAYEEVMAEMRGTVVTSGALVKTGALVKKESASSSPPASPDRATAAAADAGVANAAPDRAVAFLLEAYLDGPEVGACLRARGGRMPPRATRQAGRAMPLAREGRTAATTRHPPSRARHASCGTPSRRDDLTRLRHGNQDGNLP